MLLTFGVIFVPFFAVVYVVYAILSHKYHAFRGGPLLMGRHKNDSPPTPTASHCASRIAWALIVAIGSPTLFPNGPPTAYWVRFWVAKIDFEALCEAPFEAHSFLRRMTTGMATGMASVYDDSLDAHSLVANFEEVGGCSHR